MTIEYRWAEGQYDRLPSIIADLIEHRVAAIADVTGVSLIGSMLEAKRLGLLH